MKKSNTGRLAKIALLIALQIVFTRFFSVTMPVLRIGFGFLPVAVTSILYGPVWGGIAAAMADVIGMMLFPSGTYFPGFTLSAMLTGVIYGVFLHGKNFNIARVIASVLTIQIFVHLGLNSLWLNMITGQAWLAILAPRVANGIIMAPVMVFAIWLVEKRVLSLPAILREREA